MKKYYLLAILLFFSLGIFAQELVVVTIDECQSWAVNQSSANVQKELNEQLLKVKLNNASSHLYPSLEINGSISYQSHVPQLPETWGFDLLSRDQYGVSLDFNQVVFDGTKIFYGRKYERMMNKTDINKVELSINELKEKVISIYLNLLILDKHQAILQSVESTLSDQLKQLQTLYKEGVVYGNAVAELELQALKIEQQRSELMATRNSLVTSLSIITGKDLTLSQFVVPNAPTISKENSSLRLEYDIFANNKAGLDYQRKMEMLNSLPSISVFATGGYGRPTYDFFVNKFDWYYKVGLNFKIPVISWARTVGMGDVVKLQKQILESQESDFRKFNNIEIEEKWNEILKLESLILLDNKITAKHSEITESSKIKLLNGTITAYDYIKQQNDELQSLVNKELHSMQLLKAKYEMLALQGRL